MKLDQLTYFLEAARFEHIGKAAKALAISPSAVSHSIAALEAELKRALFFREGKRIALTPYGKQLATGAMDVLARVRQLRAELVAEPSEPRGRYRIGATHSLASDCLAPAWTKLYRAHPKVTGELLSMSSSHVIQQAAAGELDMGLCFNPQAHAKLSKRVVYRGCMVTVARLGHPALAVPPAQRLDALRHYPLAGPRLLPGIEFRDDCLMGEIERKKGELDFVYDSYDVAAKFLAGTDAWSVMPCWIFQGRQDRLACMHANPSDAFDVALVWPASRAPTPALDELARLVEAELARPFVAAPAARLQAATRSPAPKRRAAATRA